MRRPALLPLIALLLAAALDACSSITIYEMPPVPSPISQFSVAQKFDYDADGTISRSGEVLAFLISDPEGGNVQGGTVRLNGMEIPWDEAKREYHMTFDPLHDPVVGPYGVFTVSGASRFAPLVDSIQVVSGPLEMTSPRPNDTIAIAANGEITFTWRNAAIETLAFEILQESDRSGKRALLRRPAVDMGRMIIPPAVHTFTDGPITITIRRSFAFQDRWGGLASENVTTMRAYLRR